MSDDPKKIQKFYDEALAAGQEGIMAKNLQAAYQPGSRVGHMLKIKPTMETLDLVVVGGEWGEGRRAKWVGTFVLACKNHESGDFETIGKMATGLSDEQFKELTTFLKPLISDEHGKEFKIKPKLVLEIAYEEIQKSPKYESGFALRFPRLIQVREDRSPDDVTDIHFVEQLYRSQGGPI